MERIVYRKTLDVHKNGIQFTLQGFETADKMSRKIEISLMASGDTIDFPLEQITAIMYVTTPNATEPSINECTIKDNTIIYDVLPIVEEGITEMQLKLIETGPEGAKSVLATPKFAVEVTKSNTDDESVKQTVTYTALEDAIATAKGVYDSRLLNIQLDSDCMFRAYYADGTVYESDVLKELFLKGDALISQSYARGGTGVRVGEDTDNSMYYSNVSKSASEEAETIRDDAIEVLEEVRLHGVYTAFSVDFETGEVKYVSPSYKFDVNEETGELDAVGVNYVFEDVIRGLVTDFLIEQGANIEALTQSQATFESEMSTRLTNLEESTNQTNEGFESRITTLEDKPEHILVYKPGTKDLSIKGVNSTTQENLFTKPYPIESAVIPEGVTVDVSNDGTITIVVDGTVTEYVYLPIAFYNAPVGTYEVSLPKSITTDKEYDFDTAMWYHALRLENPATTSKILDIDLEMYSVKNENKFISFDVTESGPVMLNYIYSSGSLTSDNSADRVEIVIHPQLYKE